MSFVSPRLAPSACFPTLSSPTTMDKLCLPFGFKLKTIDLTGQIERTSSRPVGGGGLADIYMGKWKQADGNVTLVAIKVCRISRSNTGGPPPDKQKLLREAEIWARLNHPNITPFYGVSYDPYWADAPCFITPYFPDGNVGVYLKQNPKADRVQLVCQIAAGLAYLHRILIIHGDIKSPNVLVNNKGQACLTDFGQSLALECFGFMASCRGSIRWMAPELFTMENSRRTFATDVWALSMTALEIFTGRPPFFSTKRDEAVMYQVAKGKIPSQGDYSELGDDVWCILETCWNPDSNQRPSIQSFSLHFNVLAARRLDCTFSRFPDVAHGGHQQLFSPRATGRGSTAICFSKPRTILHTFSARSQSISCFLCTRSKSFSESPVNSLSNESPYPCQWENCQAQFDVLLDCQVHELRHKQALVEDHLTP